MTTDRVYTSFLESAAHEAAECLAASDILRLAGRPEKQGPPDTYDGAFSGVEHLVRAQDGTVRVSAEPVLFTLQFPADYLRSSDPALQFRVAFLRSAVWHPNVKGGVMVCLGPYFRAGTRLRPLLEQLYLMVSGRVRATDHAFDAEAAAYFVAHVDQIQALRARPLWRRPVAGAVRLERPAEHA